MATRTISAGTKAITDGVTTNGLNTLTSASGLLHSSMVGDAISGSNIPGGATIASVTSAFAGTISVNATGASTGITVTARGWVSAAMWAENVPPTAADDVVATGSSGNLIVSASSVCRSADFTSYTGTLSGSGSWSIGTSSLGPGNVALLLVSGMGCTYTGTLTFVSTQTGNTVTTAGKTLGSVVFNGTGGWTLQDAIIATLGGVTFQVAKGTFNSNGMRITCGAFEMDGSLTRSVTLDNSTIECTFVGTAWACQTVTNLTFSATGSTILMSGAGLQRFDGGGLTYGALTATCTGVFTIREFGNNSFTTVTRTAGKTITFPATKTTTVGSLSIDGTAGTPTVVNSDAGGTAATVSVATAILLNHCSIKDITAAGAGSITAYDSINTSGNTGITFAKAKTLAATGVG